MAALTAAANRRARGPLGHKIKVPVKAASQIWKGGIVGRGPVEGMKLDLVFVHCAFVGRYVLDCDARQRIIDFGDLDSGKWLDYSQHRAFPLSLGFGLEARKLHAYERFLASRFDHCTVTTQGELDEYRALGVPTTGSVIPNGVDTTYFRQTFHDAGDSMVIAFLGRMNYYPNVDGVLYFAQEVFPLIRRKMPKAVFRIIGSNPTRDVQSLANHQGIEVTGSVPDVRPYLKDVALTIAPLRIARGTQNKILESMAMRIPVVATPQAAKGVQAEHGRHLLVASNAHDFADRVVVLSHGFWERVLGADRAIVGRTIRLDAHGSASGTVVAAPLSRCSSSETPRWGMPCSKLVAMAAWSVSLSLTPMPAALRQIECRPSAPTTRRAESGPPWLKRKTARSGRSSIASTWTGSSASRTSSARA